MSKLIYTMAFALVLGTTAALAGNGNGPGQGDGSCVGNCPQEGGSGGPVDVSQEQSQGQLQGQSQESYNANLNTNSNSNEASAGAISGSSSDSTATGIGVGGSSVVGVAVKTGPTVSSSQSNAEGGQGGHGGDAVALGGDSSATGGTAVSGSYSDGGNAESSVGDVTSRSGDSNAYSGGNTQGVSIADNSVYSVKYEEASARAANVYSQVCQNGGSAQGFKGGFGVNNSDVLCDHLKTASVMREAYIFEMQYGVFEKCESDEHDTHTVHCTNEKAKHYYDAYHESMDDAIHLMDKVEEAGMMDKFMGYLIRPAALIGALVWLI